MLIVAWEIAERKSAWLLFISFSIFSLSILGGSFVLVLTLTHGPYIFDSLMSLHQSIPLKLWQFDLYQTSLAGPGGCYSPVPCKLGKGGPSPRCKGSLDLIMASFGLGFGFPGFEHTCWHSGPGVKGEKDTKHRKAPCKRPSLRPVNVWSPAASADFGSSCSLELCWRHFLVYTHLGLGQCPQS